jgi:hypothetical protein
VSEHFIPRIGAVFSADISVPEHEREIRFYSRVLGTGATPLWREDLMNKRGGAIRRLHALGDGGKAAAGICHARGPNARLPPIWMIYLPPVGAHLALMQA